MTTFGSVCSGIEAASVAWHPLDWQAQWLSEIESFPSKVLAHHYPGVPNHGDMIGLPMLVRCGLIPAPDILVGGTPCQAFSVAGLRQGLGDKRGLLTITYGDLLNAIDEQRPGNECIGVWENVPGVLTDKTNAFGCLLGMLAGEDCELVPSGNKWSNAGCVYGPQRTVCWRVLDAQYFGVPQRRRRVFVVASARNGFSPAEVLFESDSVRRDSAPLRTEGQGTAGTANVNVGSWWDGGQVTQTLDAVLAKGQMMPEKNRFPCVIARTVSLRGREQGATAELGGEVAGTLRASQGGGDKPYVVISPVVGFSANARVSELPGFDKDLSVSPTITRSQQIACSSVEHGLRKLTPVECERLQGFPDNYTLVPGASDTVRYKALGNSMAVPVMHWIGQRIKQQLEVTHDNHHTRTLHSRIQRPQAPDVRHRGSVDPAIG